MLLFYLLYQNLLHYLISPLSIRTLSISIKAITKTLLCTKRSWSTLHSQSLIKKQGAHKKRLALIYYKISIILNSFQKTTEYFQFLYRN